MKCIWVLLIVLSFQLGSECRKKKLPPWHIRMAQRQGPNTCAVEEVPDIGKQYWTECKYWMHRNICGRKTIIRYECCEGFERVQGENGCTGVKPLKDILQTAEDLGATIFVQYIKEAGLDSQLRQSGAITLFAPTNSAFETITREQRDMLAKSFNNPKSPILLYHLVNKRIHSKDFHSDLLVDSRHPGHQIRLNKYSSGMMTANCVPVMRKDQEANNGYVHLIENVLTPQSPKNVYQSLSNDGRFEELSRMLSDTKISDQLQQNNGFYTIFAPSDEEFTNVPRSKRQQIRNDIAGQTVLSQNHIIPHTICMSAITDEHKMTTLNGNKLTLMCNQTGLYIDGNRLVGESITGSNGVVHLIGSIIAHDRVKTVWELANQYGLEYFAHLARRSGLESQLEGYGDITLFAFTDDAFKDLDRYYQEDLIQNMQAARDLLRFHVAPGRLLRNQITDDQRVQTLDGQNSLRMRIYRKGCGVENSMMLKTDIEGLNGVIHIIDRVLSPPNGNVLDMLQRDGNFSIISEAIQKVQNVDPTILNMTRLNGGSMTFFAPSDEAFSKLGDERLREVMGNTTYLTKVVKNHIVENMISTGSFKSQLHYKVQTEENMIEVQKHSHKIKIGRGVVMRPDIVTKDGIVHTVDTVLLPEEERTMSRHHFG
uniref:Transforming growth factor-beta-induced protein ig-h3 n=1 Tax=Scolopendra viridis TaxID=118503 RepID=A0A4D5RA34_SCOVI